MWKKCALLIVVVVVLGLTGVARSELVARYTFDDGTAADWAYYYEDADGTYFGDAHAVDDPDRGAVLELDGTGDYVKVLNNQVAEFSTESFSYAFWIKSGFVGDFTYFWKGVDLAGESADDLHGVNIQHDDSAWVRFTLYNYSGPDGTNKVRTDVPDANCVTGDWTHIACVRDADADELRFYINAKLEPTTSGDTNPNEDTVKDISNTGFLYIGCNDRGYPPDTNSTPFGFVDGEIDDFRVYNHALSVQELEWLASDTVDPNLASDPSPPDGAQDECNDVVLSWKPGVNAVLHDVYFGTDAHDVKGASTLDLAVYRGRQSPNSYNAGLLELFEDGKTYYWRIDEVGASLEIWEGDVWKFRINDGKAHSPDPSDGRRLVPVAQTLLDWAAGCQADSHDVYFGTDYNDVNNADTSSDAFKGNQSETLWDPCSADPCGLDYSTDYYWRIDEVNGATKWKGDTWSFRAEGAIFDPNLRLWYKFNETAGTTARDSSGRDYDGTLSGGSGWDANGHNSGCLAIDDNGYVTAPSDVLEQIGRQITISVWLNTDQPRSDDDNVVIAAGADWEDYYVRVSVPDDGPDVSWRAGDEANDVLDWTGGSPKAWAGEWNHFGFVKDEDVTKLEIYLNGVRSSSSVYASVGTLVNVRNRRIRIGAETDDDDSYAGKMDDLMVYDRALTATEIAAIYRGGNLGIAWAPDPLNGKTDASRDVTLSWKPGDYAASHDVYFGEDFEDVNNGTPGTFIGNQEPNTFDPCGVGLLDFDTTYYWRIDEVNGPNTWTGTVWSFTTAQFDIVDDFESYDNATNKLFNTWEDGAVNGTGSFIDLGQVPFEPAHEGSQSMLYIYDNTIKWDGFHYWSEASAAISGLGVSTDWTIDGIRALTQYFYGDPGNDTDDTEQLYVALEGSYAEMRYGDNGEDMNDLKRAEWTEWNIDLEDFNQAGVDLTNVSRIYIGFGDRDNVTTTGGEGIAYFDDIRLYIQRCAPSLLKPAFD
ncbi:MAG: LamG domain-containing protein, partial [Planctomycetota bacterium]